MCGVVGALGSPSMRESMDLLRHRGIRSNNYGGTAGRIGHVRLPIVGLDEANDQPRWKGRWSFGFVGEILDFREHHPGMECDTELAFQTWIDDGPFGFTKFDGFWGIVAIDDQTKTLHVFTDYLAQKPMYYRLDVPSAASEIDALKPFGPVTLDEIYLASCIKWGYCPEIRRTPFNEIKHVLPGEHVVINTDGSNENRILDPLVPKHCTPGAMKSEIELAVRRRVLSSDVQTACLVSGGIDSAIVYTLAQRYGLPVPYHVQAAADKQDVDEYWKAQRVVQSITVASYTPGGTAEPILTQQLKRCYYENVDVETALRIMQEPIDLGSLRPQIALSRAVKERVCLTGDGADEVFGGYQRSERFDSQASDVFQELPAWHLPRLDRVMMREKIEVRSPFLARRVVQMGLDLSHEFRKNKMFLRALFRDILPGGIAEEPKRALRTAEIAHDREYYSRQLVDMFRENHRVFNQS